MAQLVGIPMRHHFPAGVLGPEPVTLDVRAHLVPHATGLVLVDTGMEAGGTALDAALDASGAAWSDVSHLVLTHSHPDHAGALAHVRQAAPGVRVLAHPAEGIAGTEPLSDGETVGTLRALATPGHTPGHLSLVDDTRGVLLVGDCLGVVADRLVRAPEPFTADPALAEQSLRLLLQARGARMVFSHGSQLVDPWDALDELLEG